MWTVLNPPWVPVLRREPALVLDPRTHREGAEQAIRATLQTLAEHLTREEARQAAGLLPVELGPWLHTGSWGAQRFDVDEFVRRVGERAQVDLFPAQRYAAAVFTALSQATPEEYDNIVAQLPKDFTPLLPRGPDIEAVPAAQFLSRIADRAGLDPDGARRATEAVLQTLAERIAGGEVRDLMMWLPVAMHDPLKRGLAESNGVARKIPLDRFIMRIAEREEGSHAVLRRDLHDPGTIRNRQYALLGRGQPPASLDPMPLT